MLNGEKIIIQSVSEWDHPHDDYGLEFQITCLFPFRNHFGMKWLSVSHRLVVAPAPPGCWPINCKSATQMEVRCHIRIQSLISL